MAVKLAPIVSTPSLGAVVDELGELLARKAELAQREEALKERLRSAGVEAVEGETFRATVSRSEVETVDWRAVAERLEPSRQLVTAHTHRKERVTVRVVSRIGEEV